MFTWSETDHSHLGTSCYRCLANMDVSSGGASSSTFCIKGPPPFFSCLGCPACGPLLAPFNVSFEHNLDCNQVEPCPPQPANQDPNTVTAWCSRNFMDYEHAVPLSNDLCPDAEGTNCNADPPPAGCKPCPLCDGSAKAAKPWSPWTALIEVGVYNAPFCGGLSSNTCHVFGRIHGVPGCFDERTSVVEALCYGE